MSQSILAVAARPKVVHDHQALMERLLAIRRGSHPILSCYLRLEPQDRAGQAYLAEFRNRAKGLQSAPAMLELERDERLSVERDLYRISGYLSHPRGLPHAPGIALFASEGLDLFEVCPLSRVHRTRVLLSQIPCLAELMAAEPGSLPILAVIIDRAHARLFEVTASHLVERSCPADPALRGGKFHSDREDAPGWGERGYHRRLQEEQHRHYANVVRNVEELLRARVFRGIVLAGPPEHTAGLSRFLPDTLAGRLLGVAKLNVRRLQSGELQRTSLMLAEHHDHEALKSELHDLDEEIGNDWGVNGPRETLRALHRGQVRTLYILDTQEGGGFRCSATGRLVLARGDCRGEGEAQPVANLVDEAIEEALRQRVRVVMVPKDSGGEAVDGLAAMLRFR